MARRSVVYESELGNLGDCIVFLNRSNVYIPAIKTYRRTVFHDNVFREVDDAIKAVHKLAEQELEKATSDLDDRINTGGVE